MLSFDIQSLESRAVVVDAELRADDPIWQEGDPLPSGPLHVSGRLSSAGQGRFYWHGQIDGAAAMPCRRCLADTTVEVHDDDLHIIFAEAGDEETDDPDVYRIAPRARELDLRPAVREQWLLEVPGYALCREDCKGLCPTCGADLNEGECECPPAADSRWDALRKIESK
jgi:uncharacterized protein